MSSFSDKGLVGYTPLKLQPDRTKLLRKSTADPVQDSTLIFNLQYTIEKYTSFNPVKDCWIPMAFSEPAMLHAIIFCSDIVNSTRQNVRESPVAIIHLRQAIAILNKRLQGPVTSITDATIVVVCALAQTEVRDDMLIFMKLKVLTNIENEREPQNLENSYAWLAADGAGSRRSRSIQFESFGPEQDSSVSKIYSGAWLSI